MGSEVSDVRKRAYRLAWTATRMSANGCPLCCVDAIFKREGGVASEAPLQEERKANKRTDANWEIKLLKQLAVYYFLAQLV